MGWCYRCKRAGFLRLHWQEGRRREGEIEWERERGGREETHRETGEVRTESILRRPEWDTQTIAGMMAKVQWTRRSDESRT